jgi:hypothetical protein
VGVGAGVEVGVRVGVGLGVGVVVGAAGDGVAEGLAVEDPLVFSDGVVSGAMPQATGKHNMKKTAAAVRKVSTALYDLFR